MIIREAKFADAKELARLSLQHGYEVSEGNVLKHLEKIQSYEDHAVYVGEVNSDELVGWVHVHGRYMIGVHPFAEIGGLVVDEQHRRKGYGEQLMRKCEEWAKVMGFEEVRLRSGGQRKGAHEFYRRIGYENVKWQEVFSLKLKD